jgi:hypothetical protein
MGKSRSSSSSGNNNDNDEYDKYAIFPSNEQDRSDGNNDYSPYFYKVFGQFRQEFVKANKSYKSNIAHRVIEHVKKEQGSFWIRSSNNGDLLSLDDEERAVINLLVSSYLELIAYQREGGVLGEGNSNNSTPASAKAKAKRKTMSPKAKEQDSIAPSSTKEEEEVLEEDDGEEVEDEVEVEAEADLAEEEVGRGHRKRRPAKRIEPKYSSDESESVGKQSQSSRSNNKRSSTSRSQQQPKTPQPQSKKSKTSHKTTNATTSKPTTTSRSISATRHFQDNMFTIRQRPSILSGASSSWRPYINNSSSGKEEDPSWEDMYHKLLQFRSVFGHPNVPPAWIGHLDLAEWASSQRHFYRETKGNDAVISRDEKNNNKDSKMETDEHKDDPATTADTATTTPTTTTIMSSYRKATDLEESHIQKLNALDFLWEYPQENERPLSKEQGAKGGRSKVRGRDDCIVV